MVELVRPQVLALGAAPVVELLVVGEPGGAIPTLYIAYLGIRHTVKRVTLEEPEDILFTELEGLPPADEQEAAAARLT